MTFAGPLGLPAKTADGSSSAEPGFLHRQRVTARRQGWRRGGHAITIEARHRRVGGLFGKGGDVEVLRTEVAIVGGGLGACAAALAAARLGCRVVLTEETHWVGGQLTNQVVPPDEHP